VPARHLPFFLPSLALPSLGRVLLVAAALSLTLSACGRRGPLEPPPGVKAGDKNSVEYPEDKQTNTELESQSGNFSTTVIGKPAKASRVIKPPKRDFVLDPLL
jgi:predicted small lipoprotein YifL